MPFLRPLIASLTLSGALLPATAAAVGTPSWPVISNQRATEMVVTARGTTVAFGASLQTLGADGTITNSRPLGPFGGQATTYGVGSIAYAGATTNDGRGKAQVLLGWAPGNTLHRATLGTTPQQVLAIDGNRQGDVVVLTGRGTRKTVWMKVQGHPRFRSVHSFTVKRIPRGGDVALGPYGDLVVAWENGGQDGGKHEIYARYRSPRGDWGKRQTLGTGVMTDIDAALPESFRPVVSWHYVTDRGVDVRVAAAERGRFAKSRSIALANGPSGDVRDRIVDGQYLLGFDKRLVTAADGQTLIAWQDYVDGRWVVRARDVAPGELGPVQELTPSGQQGILATAAIAPGGAAFVLAFRVEPPATATDRATIRLTATSRPSAGTAFGSQQAVSPDGYDAPNIPAAAVDPQAARLLVSYDAFPHDPTAPTSFAIASAPLQP